MKEGKLLTLAEVKNILEREAKKRELTYEQKLALEHARTFARISATNANKLISELKKLEFISEAIAYKIADVLPRHEDDVRAIFAKERYTLEKEDIDKILEIVGKFL